MMINLDDELAQEYLRECRQHTTTIKTILLAMKDGGLQIDDQRSNRALLAAHSIMGGSFFGLGAIHDLAQQLEDVLRLIDSHAMVPTAHRINVLLHAAEALHELVLSPRANNQAAIAPIVAALARLCVDHRNFADRTRAAVIDPGEPGVVGSLRSLLAEDDGPSLLFLQNILSRYGECHVAGNGRSAVEEFGAGMERSQRYDLVCLDIMMPEMDGFEALRQIRTLEGASGIPWESGAKIIMTTSVNDAKEVFKCFRDRCDAYLIKPIELTKLICKMKSFRLIQ